MKTANNINELSKEELLELNKLYAKNWLAHDGSWFLSIEEKYGMDMEVCFKVVPENYTSQP